MCAGEWRASIETCGGIVSIEGDGNATSIEGSGSATSIEGGGRAASIEGAAPLTKIGFANASIPSPFPTKKRTSHERFVNTFGVRSENQGFQIWRNDFGDKNGAQAKQRVEAY